jgi:hypothetical protein
MTRLTSACAAANGQNTHHDLGSRNMLEADRFLGATAARARIGKTTRWSSRRRSWSNRWISAIPTAIVRA